MSSEKKLKKKVDRYAKVKHQEISNPTFGLLWLLREASYLLSVHGPQSCPDWKEGVGDCGKPACEACRVQRCVDALEELILNANRDLLEKEKA